MLSAFISKAHAKKVLDTSSVNSFVLKMNLFFKIGLRNPLGMEHVLKMINLPMLVIIILQWYKCVQLYTSFSNEFIAVGL